MAVTNQPGRFKHSAFQSGLMSCCEDCSVCLCGTFCLPCLGCSIASDMDECCLCGMHMPMRSVYRTRYNIRGSLYEDYMAYLCCYCCAVCQLRRDIKIRKALDIL